MIDNKHSFLGQAIVELALVLPILLLLTLGTLNLGRLFYNKIALQSAAREGAYYYSYNRDDYKTCMDGLCYQGTIESVQAEANNLGVALDPGNIVVTPPGEIVSGNTITVTVSHPINVTIYSLFNGPILLTSQVRMVMQ